MERGSNLGPRALEEDALSTPSVPQVIHINFCPPYFTLFHLASRATDSLPSTENLRGLEAWLNEVQMRKEIGMLLGFDNFSLSISLPSPKRACWLSQGQLRPNFQKSKLTRWTHYEIQTYRMYPLWNPISRIWIDYEIPKWSILNGASFGTHNCHYAD